jgi:hypothetical protein
MDISCAFAPVPETPEHIALAERLRYRRAWVFDTPAWSFVAAYARQLKALLAGEMVICTPTKVTSRTSTSSTVPS